jgi:hypothetical protein
MLMITESELAEYQAIRAKEGLPEISNKDASEEASALVNLIKTVVYNDQPK